MQRWYVSGPEQQTNGGTYYRQLLPFRHLKSFLQERDIEVTMGAKLDDSYDVYFFNRALNLVYLPIIIELKRKSRIIVWDIDDDYKTLPQRLRTNAEMAALELNGLNICISIADVCTTINGRLAESMERQDKTMICPNLIDLDDHKPMPASTTGRILYTGSDTHRNDCMLIKHLYEETCKELEWVFYGHGPDWLTSDMTYVPWTRTEDYPKMLRLINPQWSLIPLRDDEFNLSKSPIKAWESALCGANVVASNWGPYAGHPGAIVGPDEPFTREDLEASNHAASVSIARENSWQEGAGVENWRTLFGYIADAASESGAIQCSELSVA